MIVLFADARLFIKLCCSMCSILNLVPATSKLGRDVKSFKVSQMCLYTFFDKPKEKKKTFVFYGGTLNVFWVSLTTYRLAILTGEVMCWRQRSTRILPSFVPTKQIRKGMWRSAELQTTTMKSLLRPQKTLSSKYVHLLIITRYWNLGL